MAAVVCNDVGEPTKPVVTPTLLGWLPMTQYKCKSTSSQKINGKVREELNSILTTLKEEGISLYWFRILNLDLLLQNMIKFIML